MGGNVTGVNKKTGKRIKAQKIDLKKAGRKPFVDKFTAVFKEINKLYKKKFKEPLWVREDMLDTNQLYNGSTSYIMDKNIPDEELLKHKSEAGDLDIIVPIHTKENLWKLLDSLEGKEIIKGVTYHGSNKETVSSIGDQINCLFIVKFDEYTALAQVDFEFLDVSPEGIPSEIAKFSHSSSFTDAKESVKAVHHKYLIFAVSGSVDVREGVAIATKASTPEKLRVSSAAGSDVIRMLKFDLNRGIGVAYERMVDKNGEYIKTEDGRDVYKEIPAKQRNVADTVRQMYQLCFNQIEGNEQDEKLFWSFTGMLELIKKYIKNKETIEKIHNRYFEKLFGLKGSPGQVLEVGNAELDYQVKITGYKKFCKALGLKEKTKEIQDYYDNFAKLRGGKLNETIKGTNIKTFGAFIEKSALEC